MVLNLFLISFWSLVGTVGSQNSATSTRDVTFPVVLVWGCERYVLSLSGECGWERFATSVNGVGLLAVIGSRLDSTSVIWRTDKKTDESEGGCAPNGKWAERFYVELISEEIQSCSFLTRFWTKYCQIVQARAGRFYRESQLEPLTNQSPIRKMTKRTVGSAPTKDRWLVAQLIRSSDPGCSVRTSTNPSEHAVVCLIRRLWFFWNQGLLISPILTTIDHEICWMVLGICLEPPTLAGTPLGYEVRA